MNYTQCAGKTMISQPMAGKTDEEIIDTREKAIAVLRDKGYEVVNTLFTDEWYSKEAMESRGVVQIPLCFPAKSLENMSLCHAAYFCKGWEKARGCKIEHDAAVAYGLEIIYEDSIKVNDRPEIYVSTFPHNMQTWYEEKITLALLALNRLKEDINSPGDDIRKKEKMECDLDTARVYVQTVLDMSVGV